MVQSNIKGIDLSPYKTATLNNLKENGKLYTAQWLVNVAALDKKHIWLNDSKNAIDAWLEEENRTNAELQAQNEAIRKDIEGLIKERDLLAKQKNEAMSEVHRLRAELKKHILK
jgi:hypothetical protein